MFKKSYLLLVIGIIIALSMLFHNKIYSAENEATLTEFTVTVTKIEASINGGTTYTTLYDGITEMDIAATDVDAKVYAFLLNTQIALGETINKVRITIDDQLSFTGYYYTGTYYYYHTPAINTEYSNIVYPDGTTYGSRTETEPAPKKATVTDLPEDRYVATLDANVIVQENQNTPLKLNFNLTNCISAVYSAPNTWVYPNSLENYCSIGG